MAAIIFFQAEDGIRDRSPSRGLGDVYKRQADSVIDLEGEIISKPNDRAEALEILKKMNGKTHQLISSVCISRGGSMIWNYTDKASLTMKNMTFLELENYLRKISDQDLYAYNVYQIEGEGRSLFSRIEGDEDTIMGLPVKKIKEYLLSLIHI